MAYHHRNRIRIIDADPDEHIYVRRQYEEVDQSPGILGVIGNGILILFGCWVLLLFAPYLIILLALWFALGLVGNGD